MAVRSCVVSVGEPSLQHAVTVTADSLYEAAALGLQALKADGWTEAIGPATRLTIRATPPIVEHQVTVQQIERWTQSTAVTPADRIRKDRVRALIDGTHASSL